VKYIYSLRFLIFKLIYLNLVDLLNNLRMNTLNTSLIFSMIKYERSNRQAPSNSLLPLEECIDELLVLLRVNLVVL
jgi:hypothetical protein